MYCGLVNPTKNICIFLKKLLTKVVDYDKILLPLKRALFLCPKKREVSTNKNGVFVQNNPKLEVPFMRVRVTLACSECKQRNYNTMKNKKNNPDRLEMNKYCRFCKKHTLHKETK